MLDTLFYTNGYTYVEHLLHKRLIFNSMYKLGTKKSRNTFLNLIQVFLSYHSFNFTEFTFVLFSPLVRRKKLTI